MGGGGDSFPHEQNSGRIDIYLFRQETRRNYELPAMRADKMIQTNWYRIYIFCILIRQIAHWFLNSYILIIVFELSTLLVPSKAVRCRA